jgi:hypothetical protein
MEFAGSRGFVMPVAPQDWAEPYFEQAREDLSAAWALFSRGDVHGETPNFVRNHNLVQAALPFNAEDS